MRKFTRSFTIDNEVYSIFTKLVPDQLRSQIVENLINDFNMTVKFELKKNPKGSVHSPLGFAENSVSPNKEFI